LKNLFEYKSSPYGNILDIENINTSLDNQWKYSPKFKNPTAETKILLTGSRVKDYDLAEKNVAIKHSPRINVWHHVWEKDGSGNYTMQLIDYKKHLETIPHAGGCKMWLLENKSGTYRSKSHKKSQSYNIFVNHNLLGSSIMSGNYLLNKVGEIVKGVLS